MSLDELVTTAEAAELSGRTPDAIKRAMYRGRLPGKKIGGGWVTTKRDLTEYIGEMNRRSRRGEKKHVRKWRPRR